MAIKDLLAHSRNVPCENSKGTQCSGLLKPWRRLLTPCTRLGCQTNGVYGHPAPGTSTPMVSIRPDRWAATSGPDALQVQMNKVRRSSPPNMQAKEPRSPVEILFVTSPPSRTRIVSLLRGSATQIAPSESKQIPSGKFPPKSAHTRRLDSVPSAALSQALNRWARVSPIINVLPSGVTTDPLGKASPLAAK
jgi:hypothetical protein